MILEFPNIDPIAFSLGPFAIRWYALAYLTGFLGGWWLAVRFVMRAGGLPKKVDIDDFVSWAIIGVILGGRLGYVLFYQWDYYSQNLGDIPKIWHGGMAFHGGALGVLAALLLFAWRRRIPVLRLSDTLAFVAPVGLFFGRLANFINGELYGRVTDSDWGMVFSHAGPEPRHPSQLYEAALEGAALFIVLFILARLRVREGVLTSVFLLGYGVARSFAELFRAPDAHWGFIIGGASMGQILSVPMIVAGAGLLLYALRRPHA
jgi:phosphatidylglycerol:prolipoprotein diacylglycerol transferase